MATLDQILAGLIAFRDEVYNRLDQIQSDIDILKTEEQEDNIYMVCDDCKGTGKLWNSPGPPDLINSYDCPKCSGTGSFKWGEKKE